MTPTIAAATIVGEDGFALPGWIEAAKSFFDHVTVYVEGYRGSPSLTSFEHIMDRYDIEDCWGTAGSPMEIRRQIIASARTDYIMFLEPEERFYRYAPVMHCIGKPDPESVVKDVIAGNFDASNLSLRVEQTGIHDQGTTLRKILLLEPDVVSLVTRHWMDFTFTRPVRNWNGVQEYQNRVVKVKGAAPPRVWHGDAVHAPAIDRFYCFGKKETAR